MTDRELDGKIVSLSGRQTDRDWGNRQKKDREKDRQTDTHRERQTHRHLEIDRKTRKTELDRLTEGQLDREIDRKSQRKTDRHTDIE